MQGLGYLKRTGTALAQGLGLLGRIAHLGGQAAGLLGGALRLGGHGLGLLHHVAHLCGRTPCVLHDPGQHVRPQGLGLSKSLRPGKAGQGPLHPAVVLCDDAARKAQRQRQRAAGRQKSALGIPA